ncbi:hypothetical protein [Hoylesella timonensis]|uniref:hypothetical protein n=1 Tax=Hoylesella timonensis TaxID=386414 RepID=UPI0012FD36DF|nr:hypothetical protein [Hoylesella timonensis]
MKMLSIFLATISLYGCKTVRLVPVPEYHTLYKTRVDTVQRWDSVRDVQWMTVREVDSTQLAALGLQIHGLKNALLIERNKLLQKISNEKTHKVDTVMQRDSIPVPYPVEKPLTKWQLWKMDMGGWAMGVAVLLVILLVVRLFKIRII